MPLDNTNWSETKVDETTEILIRARSFLERGWCRDALARDNAGKHVDPRHSDAVAWCANGALIAAGVPDHSQTATRLFCDHPAVSRLDAVIPIGACIGRFNNTQSTVEPVLAAFDRAIANKE